MCITKRKMAFIPSGEVKCPKCVIFTNDWLCISRTNNFEWNSTPQRKQFQFVDSMLFGQVRWTVYSGAVRRYIFSGKGGSAPWKNWPVRLHECPTLEASYISYVQGWSVFNHVVGFNPPKNDGTDYSIDIMTCSYLMEADMHAEDVFWGFSEWADQYSLHVICLATHVDGNALWRQ